MHPALIKAILKMRNVTQAEIARQCGNKSPAIVYQVIEGITRSKRVEMRIAAITQLSLAELWPQWHGRGAKTSGRPALTREQISDELRAAAR